MLTYDPGSSGALSYFEAAREIALRGVGIHYEAHQHQLAAPHEQQNMAEGMQ